MVKKKQTLNFGNTTSKLYSQDLEKDRLTITPPAPPVKEPEVKSKTEPSVNVETNKVSDSFKKEVSNEKKRVVTTSNSNKNSSVRKQVSKPEANEDYSYLFQNKKSKEDYVDRNYTISITLVKKIDKIVEEQNITKNTFIKDLIDIGIKEDIDNINIDTQIPISLLRSKKKSIKIRLPKNYDDKLQERKELLSEETEDKAISKSEILNILLDMVLNKIINN